MKKKNKSGNCLYIVSTSEIKDKFKVGMTKNIDERLKDLNTSSPYQFKIMEIYYTNFNVTLEKLIKEVFSIERISVNCEWYKLSALDKIKEFIDNIILRLSDMINYGYGFFNVVNKERTN